MKIYINGTFYNEEDAKISVFDHGLLYGDGVFEGIRLYDKCVFQLDPHLERLEYSAKAILLSMPWSREQIAEAVLETCRQNNLTNGYIRLVVTRGKGSLGLSPKGCNDPQLIIIAGQISLYAAELYESGLKIITVPTRRVAPGAFATQVKSLNYLNNILAKMEAAQHGYLEAIMLNEQGYVSECTADNIFIVSKGVMFTPNSSDGALKGVTREVLKKIVKELNITLRTTKLTRYDIWNADECFLTGTAAEIMPVVEVDGRKIGTGKPGAMTDKCLEVFRQKVSKEGRFL
ncbi:MAG: branched-chain-amino-acid transaminase [Verrucomicrobia bacterium]|nr:MAG: branched-chain-amino-acid transaminase [Verrucomicrobiota bacterium]